MWMYAEIIDGAGTVIVRSEAEVSQDGELTALVQSTLDRFRQAHPEKSFMTEVGQSGFTVRCGMARLANA